MELNADFSKRVAVHSEHIPWVKSPMPGVERRMLDRIGGEVARATTIVRYAPQSRFSPHVHSGGEEFLVLDGVFEDEHGRFPAGSYVRNPPQSEHAPGSRSGCTIFVKLWQFDPDDRTHVCIDTNKMRFIEAADEVDVSVMPLFSDGYEDVCLERWAPGANIDVSAPGGVEILNLAGGFDEAGETFGEVSWLRLPRGSRSSFNVSPQGAKVWIKRGHLRNDPRAPAV